MTQEFHPQSEPAQPSPDAGAIERGFQIESISNKAVFAWAFALFALAVLAVAVSFGLWAWLHADAPETQLSATGQTEALDPHQRETRLEFEREQEDHLSSYGWVEPERDIVHVPIDRAMDLLIEREHP